jgi:hypothetical protein
MVMGVPFRLGSEYGFRAKIQFTTSAEMPNLIYRACLATGKPSNTVYVQHAVAEALSRDLGIPLEQILDNLPPPRGPSAHVYDPAEGTMARRPITEDHTGGTVRVGPANTIEEVR